MRRKWMRVTDCKTCLLKAKGRLDGGPSVPFARLPLLLFYCCNLWLIVTLHISWMSARVHVHVLSAMKSLCSQRSYRPVLRSIALSLINSLKWTCTILPRLFRPHAQTQVFGERWWAVRDFPQAVLTHNSRTLLMMSHFNDVTNVDLCLAPIPRPTGSLGGYIGSVWTR